MNPTLPTLAVLALAAPAADDLTGSLAPDTRVRRTLTLSIEAESTSIEQFVGDEVQEAEGELVYALEIGAGWTDRYAELDEDGRPTVVVRSFEAAGRTELNRFGGREDESESTSPLVDHAVRFERDADGDWTARAADEDDRLDEDGLEDLDHDVDFAFLLTGGSDEDGAEWELEVGLLRRLMRPSGELGFPTADPEPVRAIRDAATEDLWDDVDGELLVRRVGIEERDGVELVRYAIEVEAEGLGEAEAELDDPDTDGASLLATGLEVELEGELLWDPAAGHARSFELSGEILISRRQGVRLTAPSGDEVELGQRVELEGELAVVLVTERLSDDD